jgi:hypothetical protein
MPIMAPYCTGSAICAVQGATILLLCPIEWNFPVNRRGNSYV